MYAIFQIGVNLDFICGILFQQCLLVFPRFLYSFLLGFL